MIAEIDRYPVWVHLYGGEQDGFLQNMVLTCPPPKLIFIWQPDDAEGVAAEGSETEAIRSGPSTLAYELFETVERRGEPEHRYRRLISADKSS